MQTEKKGGGLALFYDGKLLVNNFSNKCFTNLEVAFLELTLGKSDYLLVCLYRQPNTNVRVFISELTSFIEGKALLRCCSKFTYCRRYQYFYAAIKLCVKQLNFFLDEFDLQHQIIVPTRKYSGSLDQVISSEEVEVSEPLVSFLKSSDHGVLHFGLLQEHKHLTVKK